MPKRTQLPVQQDLRRRKFSGHVAGSFWTQLWTATVSRVVSGTVSSDVSGNRDDARRLTGLSAGARQPGCSARAVALWSNNHAVCCGRSQKNPHDYCSIHPQPCASAHSALSWAPRCSGLRGGPGRKLACGRSAKAFPKRPAARTAPDHRPIHSLRSFMTRPVVRRAARFGSTASVAPWGAPAAVARWGSLLLLRGPVQSALGRFLRLGPPGGVPSPLSGPGGACAHACLGAGRCLPKPKTPRGLRVLGHKPCGLFPVWLPVAGAHRQNAILGSRPFSNATFIQSRKEMLCLC